MQSIIEESIENTFYVNLKEQKRSIFIMYFNIIILKL